MLVSGKDEKGNPLDVDAITAELRSLNDELADIERREQVLGEMGGGTPSEINNPINGDNDTEPTQVRSILASPEYRNAFGKSLLGRTLSDKEHRALDTALTTTATTYTAPSPTVDGVNNGGLFIPTDINLALLERIGLVSPIFRDINKTTIPGLTKFPYRKTVSTAKNVKETDKSPDLSIEWAELSLALSEIAATIPVSWRLEAMAVEEFLSYLTDELIEQVEDKGITESIYGTGATGNQMSGIAASAVKYQYTGTALDAIGVALGKFTSKKHKVGAKIYVSQSIIEEISFTKDTNGNYIYTPINGAGIKSLATYQVEADPYLNDGDFIIGNLHRYYRMNEHEPLSITRDVSGKNRRNDYTAWGIWSGALQPDTVVYGSKKANS